MTSVVLYIDEKFQELIYRNTEATFPSISVSI
jgi:hypothetical protein